MNKRKFSLGEIVSKLNQENAGQPTLPVTENTPSQPVKESSSAPAASIVNKTPDREQPEQSNAAPNDLPHQPDFNQHPPLKWVYNRPVEKQSIAESEKKSEIHHHHVPKKAGSDSIPVADPTVATTNENPQSVPTAPSVHHPIGPTSSFQEKFRSDDSDDEEESLDIFKYIGIILRRRYVIIAIALISALFSVYRYSTSDKFYITNARLLFSPDLQDLTNDYRFFAYQMDKEKQLNTHLELLRSPTVLNMVAENIGDNLTPGDVGAGLTIKQGETNGEKNDIMHACIIL